MVEKRCVFVDVKPNSFLLDDLESVRLNDFSNSLALEEGFDGREQIPLPEDEIEYGTFTYFAPERTTQRATPNFNTDIYAYGIACIEILSDFGNIWGIEITTIDDLRDQHTAGNSPIVPESTPAPVKELLLECVSTDPKARPTADQVFRRMEAYMNQNYASSSPQDETPTPQPPAKRARVEGVDDTSDDQDSREESPELEAGVNDQKGFPGEARRTQTASFYRIDSNTKEGSLRVNDPKDSRCDIDETQGSSEETSSTSDYGRPSPPQSSII
ncbi:kinase-like domain-containing protein [Polychytrium aggregatum]|uniref:kinase-like domain-containing protein n=1 Tax=Polychytrium aggregatum TaxID=110093 RepID=UPI0022FDE217|nr:kinase-like domain-containing protein [Polychytrium aggregatum]KAI9204321.1 kinase-like domain-containing protein [Polychytrium aggregatum]